MNPLLRPLIALSVLVALAASLPAEEVPKPIRVALYSDAGAFGEGIPRVKEQLAAAGGFQVVEIQGAEIAEGSLSTFDVVVFPGGAARQQADTLGEEGRERVRDFVREGGGFVGICAGAYLACSGFDWGVGVLNARTVPGQWRRGEGEVEMEISDAGSGMIGLPAETRPVRYVNGPILAPHDREDIPAFRAIAVYRTELAENDSPAGAMIGSPAIALGSFGQGRVVVSSPHPEQTRGLENFSAHAISWAAGKGQ